MMSLLSFLPPAAVTEIKGFLRPFPIAPNFPTSYERFVQTVQEVYHHYRNNSSVFDLNEFEVSYREVYDLRNFRCIVEKTLILELSIVYYKKEGKTSSNLCIFTCQINGIERKECYFLKEGNVQTFTKLTPIYFFLNGNEYEKFWPDEEISLLQPSYWDDWKDLHRDVRVFYDEVIYPLFSQAVQDYCLFTSDLTVLDLGGSEGDLSLLVAAIPQVKRVILVDQNRVAIQKANKNKKKRGYWDKIEPSQCDIRKNAEISALLDPKSCDIILLSGVIHTEVMSDQDSWSVLQICRNILKPGGIILISGYSQPYFRSADYVKGGFTVLNKSAWFFEIQDQQRYQSALPFYVLSIG